jgi:hypothetical protein
LVIYAGTPINDGAHCNAGGTTANSVRCSSSFPGAYYCRGYDTYPSVRRSSM